MPDSWTLDTPDGPYVLNQSFTAPKYQPGGVAGPGALRRDDRNTYQRSGDGLATPGPLTLIGRVWRDDQDQALMLQELEAIRAAVATCTAVTRSNNAGEYVYDNLAGGATPEVTPDGLGGWVVKLELWPGRAEPTFIPGGESTPPDQVPNLALWLDAADGNAIVFDSPPIVTGWLDKSVNGWDAMTSRTNPSLIAVTPPTLRFTRNTEMMVPSQGALDNLIHGQSGLTLLAVADRPASADAFPHVFAAMSGANRRFSLAWVRATELLQVGIDVDGTGATYTYSSTPFTSTDLAVIVASVQVSDGFAHVEIHVNGASVASQAIATAGSAFGGAALDSIRVGGRYVNAANRGGWEGQIGEILVYQRALATAEREGVEAYLNHKWGILI